MTVRIKVCGITRLEDALRAVELGADALGFVFWPDSPRYIDPARARAIAARLPPMVAAVGVFVDQPLAHVRDIADRVGLGAVQLHGSEPFDYCAQCRVRVIKAVPVAAAVGGPGSTDQAATPGIPGMVDAWPPEITPLLDAHDPLKRGGTGRTIDWASAACAARVRPIVLAGGLRAENIRDAIAAVQPYAVDVSSGVETSPGVKDHGLLQAFFEAIRGVRLSRTLRSP